jgi:hypothetical protein
MKWEITNPIFFLVMYRKSELPISIPTTSINHNDTNFPRNHMEMDGSWGKKNL